MLKSVLSCAAIVAVVVALVVGCGGGGNSLYPLSVARLKNLNAGLLMYGGDWDDAMPLGASWMDALGPYVANSEAFHSPAVPPGAYGYALNTALAGHSLGSISDREHTLSIFDSTDLTRNAVTNPSSVPTPPRYGNRNTLAYADGHVQDEDGYPPTPEAVFQRSRTRLKSVSMASFMYSSDHDDFAPLAGRWVDDLSPYDTSLSHFRSPKVEMFDPNLYGYAFNIDVVGTNLSQLPSPWATVTFFDSTVLTRNATESTATMPNPPRYQGKNTIAYADGHVPD